MGRIHIAVSKDEYEGFIRYIRKEPDTSFVKKEDSFVGPPAPPSRSYKSYSRDTPPSRGSYQESPGSEIKVSEQKNSVKTQKTPLLLRNLKTDRFFGILGYSTTQSALAQRRERIDTTQMYRAPTEREGSYRILTGIEAQELITQQMESNKALMISSEKSDEGLQKYISGSPKGTQWTIIKTESGSSIYPRVPETSQLYFSEKITENITSSYPPGVSHLMGFGFGISSASRGIIAPVADVLGVRKEFDIATAIQFSSAVYPFDTKKTGALTGSSLKYYAYSPVHYPSALDIVFEPFGLSPKGSTSFLLSKPEVLAGGIGFEASAFIAGGEILKGIGYGVGRGTAIISKRTPNIVGRLTSKLGTRFPSITSRISNLGESSVIRNFLRYGQGWRKGYLLMPSGYSPVRGIGVLGENITKKVPYKVFGRMWLSPEAQVTASQRISRLTSPVIDIAFPSVKQVDRLGGRFVISSMSRESGVLRGFFRPRLTLNFYGETARGSQLSWFYRKPTSNVLGRVVDKPSWYGSYYNLGKIPRSGLSGIRESTVLYGSGERGLSTTLKGLQTPLPKSWFSKLSRIQIWRKGYATQSLLFKPDIKTLNIGSRLVPSSSQISRMGVIVPAFERTVFTVGAGVFSRVGVETGVRSNLDRFTIPVLSFESETKRSTLPRFIVMPSLDTEVGSRLDVQQVKVLDSKQEMVSSLALESAVKMKGDIRNVYSVPVAISVPSVPFVPVVPRSSKFGIYDGGTNYSDLFGNMYRYRSFNIGIPNILKGVSI